MESADRGEGTTDPPTVSWEQAVRARIAAGVRRGGRYAWRLLQAWRWDAWDVFQRKGYLLIATLVAAYVGLYSVMEARHERRANRALFERANFMTMVASGNQGTFIAAMKTFGEVQTMTVPRDPELLDPRTWFRQDRPNETPLHRWVGSFFPLCTAHTCGQPDTEKWRIDLRWARLREANLVGAGLRKANLTGAYLIEANLTLAHLTEANLTGAYLLVANLTEARLRKANMDGAHLVVANLAGADLRDVIGLTQEQLDTACVDDATQLPDGLTRPEPCPPSP